jgi:hypothetical protein
MKLLLQLRIMRPESDDHELPQPEIPPFPPNTDQPEILPPPEVPPKKPGAFSGFLTKKMC